MPVILARAWGLRRVAPHSMSSAHRSEEKANSPLTFSVPSGRVGLAPTPPAVPAAVPVVVPVVVLPAGVAGVEVGATIIGSPSAATGGAPCAGPGRAAPPRRYAAPRAA